MGVCFLIIIINDVKCIQVNYLGDYFTWKKKSWTFFLLLRLDGQGVDQFMQIHLGVRLSMSQQRIKEKKKLDRLNLDGFHPILG